MHQMNFPSVVHTSTAPFQIIHTDMWGPSSVLSLDGFRFYLLIVDEFTRYTWIYPLHAKSEVASVLTQFITLVERQFSTKVKVIQCDNGSKFTVLRNQCAQHGIVMQHSCPYTNQQNGLVERKHQHVTEVGFALFATAFLLRSFWWEAIYSISQLHSSKSLWLC